MDKNKLNELILYFFTKSKKGQIKNSFLFYFILFLLIVLIILY